MPVSSQELWGEEHVLITGGPATGKTTALADHAVNLLKSGVPGSEVAIFCASPATKEQMRLLLAQRLDAQAFSQVRISTPWETCLELLETAEAQEHTGRVARILSDAKIETFVESLEAPDGKRERSFEIVKFLLREWTELGDDNERFIVCYEEEQLNTQMKSRLRAMGAMLPHELANLAVNLLRQKPELLRHWGANYVLVDDYQNLCRASQVFTCMLHRWQIVVAGYKPQACRVLDPHPYPKGLDEFLANNQKDSFIHVGLSQTYLSRDITAFVQAFLGKAQTLDEADLGMSCRSDNGAVYITRHPSCEGELQSTVRTLLGMDKSERKNCLVIVPDSTWETHARSALRDAGIKATLVATPAACAGLRFDTVFVLGALDGCYPSARSIDPQDTVNHRAYYLAQDERVFYAAVTRANDSLYVSHPLRTSLEQARTLGAKVARISVQNGVSTAQLAPSRFLPIVEPHRFAKGKP